MLIDGHILNHRIFQLPEWYKEKCSLYRYTEKISIEFNIIIFVRLFQLYQYTKIYDFLVYQNLPHGNILNFASLQYKVFFIIVLNELNMNEIPSKKFF